MNEHVWQPRQKRPQVVAELATQANVDLGPQRKNALMAGLDRVKGPHWSQILAMFGPGGTTNETLKDRNQVQLKDKARNLKLFFLKSSIEVPYYLSFVTGELKTRAPAQAAKNEAKEKEKLSDERAQVEDILTPTWGSVEDCEHTVDGETGVDKDSMDNETEESVEEQEIEVNGEANHELNDGFDDGADDRLDEGQISAEDSESSMDGICNSDLQIQPLANNTHINGDQTAENMDLGRFLAEASKLGFNEATKVEDLITS